MAHPVVRIKSDANIKRIVMREGSVTRARLEAKARKAAQYYHENIAALHFQYEQSGYPFAPHTHQNVVRPEEPGSVRKAPVRFKVDARDNITIIATAESAKYIEEGNAPVGGGSIHAKSKPLLAIRTNDGRFYLLPDVEPMDEKILEGFNRPLHRAIKKAFASFKVRAR